MRWLTFVWVVWLGACGPARAPVDPTLVEALAEVQPADRAAEAARRVAATELYHPDLRAALAAYGAAQTADARADAAMSVIPWLRGVCDVARLVSERHISLEVRLLELAEHCTIDGAPLLVPAQAREVAVPEVVLALALEADARREAQASHPLHVLTRDAILDDTDATLAGDAQRLGGVARAERSAVVSTRMRVGELYDLLKLIDSAAAEPGVRIVGADVPRIPALWLTTKPTEGAEAFVVSFDGDALRIDGTGHDVAALRAALGAKPASMDVVLEVDPEVPVGRVLAVGFVIAEVQPPHRNVVLALPRAAPPEPAPAPAEPVGEADRLDAIAAEVAEDYEPKVRAGKVTRLEGSGRIAIETVQRVAERRLGAIKYCYEEFLRGAGSGNVNVTLAVTIGDEGRPTKVEAVEPVEAAPTLVRCVVDKVESWRFEIPVGGSATFALPFNLWLI